MPSTGATQGVHSAKGTLSPELDHHHREAREKRQDEQDVEGVVALSVSHRSPQKSRHLLFVGFLLDPPRWGRCVVRHRAAPTVDMFSFAGQARRCRALDGLTGPGTRAAGTGSMSALPPLAAPADLS